MAQALDELLRTHVARFTDRRADWDAFADARVEGFKRAQHRFIGSGASVPHPVPWTLVSAVTRSVSGDTWIWAARRSRLLSQGCEGV